MRATEALLLAAYDEKAVVATALGLLGEHFGYGTCYLLLVDKSTGELAVVDAAGAGADRPEVRGFRTTVGVGLTGTAAQARRTVNVGDVRTDPRYIDVIPGCLSEICVPLVVRDDLLGVLAVDSTRAAAFDARDEELLTAFSQVTALALMHARADERNRGDIAQFQAVKDVATAAASLDLDATLRAAVDSFQRATTSNSTAIHLWDEATQQLSLACLTFEPKYYPPDYEAAARASSIALGEGMIGWAAQTRQAALINDTGNDPRPQPLPGIPLGGKSAIVVPLVVEDRLLGVVRAVKMGVGSYSQEHFRLAQTIASQVALLLAAAQARTEERQRFTELSAVHDVSRRLAEVARLGEVLSYVLEGAIRLTGAEAGVIWRLDDKDAFFVAASHDLPAERIAQHPPNAPDSVSRRIIASGRALRVPDVQLLGRAKWPVEVPHLHALLGIPLRSEGRAYGSLLVLHRTTDFFRPDSERVLEVIAAQAAAAIARAEALEEAQRLAITDGLTGLYNARYLSSRLEAEIQRAKRYGHKLTLTIVDSDALKLVNDRLGHAAGNELLVSLARNIRSCVRASDLVARFGGDEFVILQPESGLEAAVIIADRIRTAAYAASDVAGVERSVSAGVATYPDHAADPESLFQQADAALYRAKRSGKNRVETAPA